MQVFFEKMILQYPCHPAAKPIVPLRIIRPRAHHSKSMYACPRQAFGLEDPLRSATRPYTL